MTKKEIKNLADNTLIMEYVLTYSHRDSNFVLGRGTEQLSKQAKNFEDELIRRNILTEADVAKLNL